MLVHLFMMGLSTSKEDMVVTGDFLYLGRIIKGTFLNTPATLYLSILESKVQQERYPGYIMLLSEMGENALRRKMQCMTAEQEKL